MQRHKGYFFCFWILSLMAPVMLFSKPKEIAEHLKRLEKTTESDIGSDDAKAALQSLQKSMANVANISADFKQDKRLSLFSRTITLTGHLEIKFPHFFRWEVYSPVKTIITADGERVTIWDEETNQTNSTSVNDNPVVKNIWTQIDSWFMGRYSVLAKDYKIKVLKKEPLELVFKPRAKPLSAAVDSITIFFRKDRKYLNKVILKETGGDSTVMKFLNIVIQEKQDIP
jgi:outer membrane lipoprotein-sorting protein